MRMSAVDGGSWRGRAGQGSRGAADGLEPTNVRYVGTNANGLIFEDVLSLFEALPEVGEPATGHPLTH